MDRSLGVLTLRIHAVYILHFYQIHYNANNHQNNDTYNNAEDKNQAPCFTISTFQCTKRFVQQRYEHVYHNFYTIAKHDRLLDCLSTILIFTRVNPLTLCMLEPPKRILWQTVKTQMKCSIMLHFIGINTFC